MSRVILDPIGEMRMREVGVVRVALAAKRLVDSEGSQVVSMDSDGKVYATPPRHPFSTALMKHYADNVVGTYGPASTAEEIRDDLVAQWDEARKAA
jgi:hypothetical protein